MTTSMPQTPGLEVSTPDGTGEVLKFEDLTEDQLEKELATVLDRGLVNARLHVDLPSDMYGEWVPYDPLEIQRKRSLGFSIDRTYATKSALHSDDSGNPRIGDVIHMTCPMRIKIMIDKIHAKRYEENHGKRRKELKQAEEKGYLGQKHATAVDSEVTKVHSEANVVGEDVIKAAKDAMKNEVLSKVTTGG